MYYTLYLQRTITANTSSFASIIRSTNVYSFHQRTARERQNFVLIERYKMILQIVVTHVGQQGLPRQAGDIEIMPKSTDGRVQRVCFCQVVNGICVCVGGGGALRGFVFVCGTRHDRRSTLDAILRGGNLRHSSKIYHSL
jgi:hypothetical protein